MGATVELRQIRLGLYVLLCLWAFLLLAISAARINYTEHLDHRDPLNGGHSFTDPSVAELLFTSIVTLIFAPTMMIILYQRIEHRFASRTWFEIIGLMVLWLFWLGGTAAATNVWPATLLASCGQFSQCRLLQALLAFAWLGWITLTAQLGMTLWFAVQAQAWQAQVHDEWADRQFALPRGERKV